MQTERRTPNEEALLQGLISVLLTVGGSIEVSDATVASIDLDKDTLEVVQNVTKQSHTVSVVRTGGAQA